MRQDGPTPQTLRDVILRALDETSTEYAQVAAVACARDLCDRLIEAEHKLRKIEMLDEDDFSTAWRYQNAVRAIAR